MGLKRASAAIGLAPSTVTSVLAGLVAMPGTIAILADYHRRRADAETKVTQLTGQVTTALRGGRQ